ncbi:MAG: FtsX-like permease family protein [Pseudomonadota bacterium]
MLSLTLARRYLFSGRKRFAAFITWSSVFGLALGVLVLTVVVSVMNGFERELRERLLGAVPHVFVQGPQGADSAADTVARESLAEQLRRWLATGSAAGIDTTSIMPFFQGQAMLSHLGVVTPLAVQGLPQLQLLDATAVPRITPARLDAAAGALPEIYLGAPLVAHFGLGMNEALTLLYAEATATGVRPAFRRYRLAGTFELGAELDTSLALIPLAALSATERATFGREGVRIQLRDPTAAPRLKQQLIKQLPNLRSADWTATYGEFFRAVALEKAMMFVVLLLVVAVATFNIVSGQLMVVSEKRSDIAILRTMGTSATTIRRAFAAQGVVIALLGVIAGLLVGVWCARNVSALVSWLSEVTAYQLLAGTYFVELPSEVRLGDLLVIAAMAVLLALIAAWLPAARAARINPIDGLH